MPARVSLKDDQSETRLIQRRLFVAALVVVLSLMVLGARLYVLQVLEHKHYSTLSDSNRVRIKPLPPSRGLIFDRNGVALAENLPAYRLEIVREKAGELGELLPALRRVISVSDYEIKRYKDATRRKRRFESVPLRLNLSDDEVAAFAVNQHLFDGVEINARLTRHYPQGELAVHALGYVGRIDDRDLERIEEARYAGSTHIGKIGLERFYEEVLHGQVGVQRVEVNASGRTLRVLEQTPPKAGDNLILTLDSQLQRVAEAAFNGQNGALVAIDPNNGEVLALVSRPGFDPNLFVNGISYRDYNGLRDSTDRPLFNRALTGQYPPGSTTKPLIGLAGLEHEVVSQTQKIHCPGFYRLPNDERRYRDWKKEGHGLMTLGDAISQSCDVYFYDMSYRLGIDKMSSYLARFGLGVRSGIDTTGEAKALLPTREWKRGARGQPWFPGETLITGIGQGAFTTTPLQLANATAQLAVQGVRYKPHLLKQQLSADLAEVQNTVKEQVASLDDLTAEHWRYIVEGMRSVTSHWRGTAFRPMQGLEYSMAGKTGTAQVFSIAQDEEYDEETVAKKLRDHALFVAFAPIENPQIAVAVVVDNGGHGSSVAAPIARKVMDEYLLRPQSRRAVTRTTRLGDEPHG